MKIGKSKGAAGVSKGGKSGKSSAGSAVDFRQLLQAQLGGIGQVEQAAPTSEVADRQVIPPQLRLEGVQLAEATIDSLAAFAKALGDVDISGPDLEAFITALEEEGQGLVDLVAQLPKDDPLAQLIEQVATSCFLETSKFRRGDYL